MHLKIICEACGAEFKRKKSEATRNAKLGRRTFCSLACQGKHPVNNLSDAPRVFKHLQKYQRLNDEFSLFRNHLRIARMHCKQRKSKRECSVTLADLKSKWDAQSGICPYTGWKMKTPVGSHKKHKLPYTPDRASLDRIDSSKGYIRGNVQFVSLMAQYAKNKWDDKELLDFCKAVVKHQGSIVTLNTLS